MSLVTHPYWPLKKNSWVEYNCFDITGYYHPDSMEIDVWSATYKPHGNFPRLRRTIIDVPHSCNPSVAIVDTNEKGPLVPPADWPELNKSLYQGLWKTDLDGWIGEAGTLGTGWFDSAKSVVMFPPEPEIPLDITKYKTAKTGVTKGYEFHRDLGTVQEFTLEWKFRNLGVGSGPNETWWWPQYPYQLRTALEERPDTFGDGNYVYNYLFAKDIGLCNFWWGLRASDNKVKGWMWQMVSYG